MKTSHPTYLSGLCSFFMWEYERGSHAGLALSLSELKSISVMSGTESGLPPTPPPSLCCCHHSIHVSEVTVLDEGIDSGLSGSV